MLYPIKVRPLTSCHLPCHRNEIATDSHFSSQAATLVSRFSRLRCSTLDALSCTWLTEGKRETARSLIDHFTVVCLVTWPLNDSEACGDLVLIQTSLLLLCKSSCSYAN